MNKIIFLIFMMLAHINCFQQINSELKEEIPSKTKKENELTCANDWNVNYLGMYIMGGFDAPQQEFPYIVALGLYDNTKEEYKFNCGGSLISSSHVLTAAHCVENPDNLELKIVRIGKSYAPEFVRQMDPTYDVEVKTVIVHPEYDRTQRFNDIAIAELWRTLLFNEVIIPIALYRNQDDPAELQIAGWGSLGFKLRKSTFLQTAIVPSVPIETCQELYLKKNRKVLHTHICAGNNKQNFCDGDSGGPLHIIKDNKLFLVGVTSYGQICGSIFPGVFTRVSSHLDWIDKTVSSF